MFVVGCSSVFCASYDCLYFFFFKQKTAYEMRISDCSSDVCSSDLRGRPTLESLFDRLKEGENTQLNLILKGDVSGSVEAVEDALLKIEKIGRAACRESVCQYV